ncbi:MAG: LytTR family transcriptional regulator DNA-binding domain-containing protein [Hyphomonadaceae bacterium]|nr:LytTR family transcriptional regulator DNA-binding domain-containing protein [Hyphomonadaceae bacterium]
MSAPEGLIARVIPTVTAYARERWRGYAAAAIVGVFLAISGAFGTEIVPLPQRLSYWLTLMLAGSMIGLIVGPFAAQRPRIGENRVLAWAVVTVSLTLPLTVFVWWFTGLVFGARAVSALPYFLGVTGVVTAAMTALTMIVDNPGPATHAPPKDAAPARVRFMDRLPPKLMGAIVYAVQSEDHYLRLHTSKGSDLILMRLADAIAELEGIEGAQVHRSWWVARDAVTDVKRENGRVTLLLPGDVEAPVSRPNVKALRDAGWI